MFNQEQENAINSNADKLVILAFAGSGKSTTLDGYSRARPSQRILNLCFNKSVQLAAEKRFPANVTNKTSHAMAFPKFGANYADAKKTCFVAKTFRCYKVIT